MYAKKRCSLYRAQMKAYTTYIVMNNFTLIHDKECVSLQKKCWKIDVIKNYLLQSPHATMLQILPCLVTLMKNNECSKVWTHIHKMCMYDINCIGMPLSCLFLRKYWKAYPDVLRKQLSLMKTQFAQCPFNCFALISRTPFIFV